MQRGAIHFPWVTWGRWKGPSMEVTPGCPGTESSSLAFLITERSLWAFRKQRHFVWQPLSCTELDSNPCFPVPANWSSQGCEVCLCSPNLFLFPLALLIKIAWGRGVKPAFTSTNPLAVLLFWGAWRFSLLLWVIRQDTPPLSPFSISPHPKTECYKFLLPFGGEYRGAVWSILSFCIPTSQSGFPSLIVALIKPYFAGICWRSFMTLLICLWQFENLTSAHDLKGFE